MTRFEFLNSINTNGKVLGLQACLNAWAHYCSVCVPNAGVDPEISMVDSDNQEKKGYQQHFMLDIFDERLEPIIIQ